MMPFHTFRKMGDVRGRLIADLVEQHRFRERTKKQIVAPVPHNSLYKSTTPLKLFQIRQLVLGSP